MKRILVTTILILTVCLAFSQEKTITDELKQQYLQLDTSNIKTVYCEIIGTQKAFSKQVTIQVDFGQETKYVSDNRLFGKDGKPVLFNSMMDVLNYMGDRGWTLHSTMLIGDGNYKTYHFIMEKKLKIKQ